jgi:sporulation protein YtfJ
LLTNIKIIANIENDDNNLRIKAFGICIYNLKKRNNKKNRKDKKKPEKKKNQDKNQETKTVPSVSESAVNTENKQDNQNNQDNIKPEQKPVSDNKSENKNEKSEDKSSIKSKIKNAFNDENKENTYQAIAYVLVALRKLIKQSKIKNLYIDIKVSDFDAYETAMKYVQYNQAVWNIVGFVSTFMSVYRKKIKISPDFGKNESIYKIEFDFRIRFINLIAIVVAFIIAVVRLNLGLKTGKNPEKILLNENREITEKEYEMKEANQLNGLMGVTMEKIREMVDVNTIIGEQIKVNENVTIIPVSKVSYGFGSGGSDLPVKNSTKDLFGGGAGAGVSIKPIGFLVVTGDNVKFMQVKEDYKATTIADVIPSVVDTVSSLVSNVKNKNDDNDDDDDDDDDDNKKGFNFFKKNKKSSENSDSNPETAQPETEE